MSTLTVETIKKMMDDFYKMFPPKKWTHARCHPALFSSLASLLNPIRSDVLPFCGIPILQEVQIPVDEFQLGHIETKDGLSDFVVDEIIKVGK